MTCVRTVLTGSAATGLAAFALVVPAAGKAPSRRPCDAHRHAAALVSREVVVYGRQRPAADLNGPETVYFACFRPRGASVELGVDGPDTDEYGPEATTGDFNAAGTYVAAHSSDGEASLAECAKYSTTQDCPPPSYWISVADTKTRRHVNVHVYTGYTVPSYPLPPPVPLALSRKGAVAWLEPLPGNGSGGYYLWATALHPRGRSSFTASPSKIDAGSIDPHSLRFGGRTLHWVRDGHQYEEAVT